MEKRTKIVCTIGPASDSEEMLEKLMKAGMNVARLNFSHGTQDEHQQRIDRIKRVSEKLKKPTAIMLDTKGPEIRLGKMAEPVVLEIGDKFTLTSRELEGNKEIASQSHIGLPKDVKKGTSILIDDGLVELKVIDIKDDTDIICEVINSGEISSNKGINVPGIKISLPAITEKDKSDIIFGIKNDIDFIAASFVRKREDVMEIREILEQNAGEFIHIIPKIENQEGIDNIDSILEVSDGLMIARGDMGVEVATENIALVQKELIKKCVLAGKPVITATQMLDSMIRNPRPTRAEVTDVANAILDGTSAIMLSGETASGKYPEEAVKTMNRIALKMEDHLDLGSFLGDKDHYLENTTTNTIGESAVKIADELEAAAIIASTLGGSTARSLSKFRPSKRIIAITTSERIRRQLSLVWGVEAVVVPVYESTDDLMNKSLDFLVEHGYLEEGDLVVITAGIPVGSSGSTNLIKVQTIASMLSKGVGIGEKVVTSKVSVGSSKEELDDKFEDGDILVCGSTNSELVDFMRRSSGVIVEEGGFTSHAVVVGLDLRVPTIVGAGNVTRILKDGDIITIDSKYGFIYRGEVTVR